MSGQLPVDFEEKVKLPPAGGGAGYPFQLSAKDLMKNFVYAAIEKEEGFANANGINFTVDTGQGGHSQRRIWATSVTPGVNQGDMLYWEGDRYTFLPAPSAGAVLYFDGETPIWLDPPSGSVMHVLAHDGTAPMWVETEDCET